MRLSALVPIAVVALLAVVFLVALFDGGDDTLPSHLVGKPAPDFALERLAPAAGVVATSGTEPGDETAGLTTAMLSRGEPVLVNFWASWCAPCRVEHPVFMRLAGEGVPIFGVNYKDEPDNALRFLRALGDPYERIGRDATGRTAIDWGVYGVPETYVVSGQGIVMGRHVGPVTPEVWRDVLKPLMEKARRAPLPAPAPDAS